MDKLTYTADDITIEICVKEDTAWLTQKELAKLLKIGVNKIGDMINEHLSEGEITGADILTETAVQTVSCRRIPVEMRYYNMNVLRHIADKSINLSAFEAWLTENKLN